MIAHLNKKNKCNRVLESYKYKEDELYNLSLIRNDKIYDKDNNNEKIIKCEYCNKIFSKNFNLKRHMSKSCKINNISIDNKTINNNIINNTTNNMTNNITTNANIQIMNPFNINSTWSLDHIDVNEQYNILKTNLLYYNTLEKILENDENLNLIINNDNAIVYNNNKIENMELDKLYRLVIGKLNSVLYTFKNKVEKSNIVDKNIKIIEEANNMADKILYNYKNNTDDTRLRAKTMINDVYGTKREKTEEMFKKVSENKKLGYF